MTKRKQPNVMLHALQDVKREIKKRNLPTDEEQRVIQQLERLYIEYPKRGVKAFWGEEVIISPQKWQDISMTINRELLDNERQAIQQTLNKILTIYKHNNQAQLRTQVIKAELVKITKQKEEDVIYIFNLCSDETREKLDNLYWEISKKNGIDAATPAEIKTLAAHAISTLTIKEKRRYTSALPLLVQDSFRLWAMLGQTNFKASGSEKNKKSDGFYEPKPQSLTAFIRVLSTIFLRSTPCISDVNKLIRKHPFWA